MVVTAQEMMVVTAQVQLESVLPVTLHDCTAVLCHV